ncbi:MAG: c-type cytochrome [Alphaproteobacteria bacterium]|nr:c-type cytochrome [Alphaproteobacteria bacterium]
MTPLLLILAACGPSEYDIDTWESPLASGFDGTPDAAMGEDIYTNEHWLDDSPYALTCFSCHSVSADDTLYVDADDLNRPAHTVWNVAWRETWKANHSWDADRDDDVIGAYGGQICVRAYFPDGSEMTAEQAAHLEAWLRDQRDAAPEADDPRAAPLDFGFTTWGTKDSFLASIQEGGEYLRGAALGDVEAGEALVQRYCGACHVPEGESSVVLYTAATATVPQLLARIRKADVDGVSAPNARMPRLPAERLSDEDLRDLVAFLTEPVE